MDDNIEAIQHPFTRKLLTEERSVLFDLVGSFGSAIHVLLPEVFRENIHAFRDVFEKHNLQHEILFAAKANKAKCFLEMASREGIGTDVSSIYELRSSLSHGIEGNRIGITGPMKTDAFLLLATKNSSIVSIDSFDELERLSHLDERGLINRTINITLRLGGLTNRESRFGFHMNQLSSVYKYLKDHDELFCLKGFGFHMAGYSVEERIKGILMIVKEIERIRSKGFSCTIIDIGGGFTIRYLENGGWEMIGFDRSKFYNNKTFSGYYPYSHDVTKEAFLDNILSARVEKRRKDIGEILNSSGLSLIIEPGRSLLDQAGCTIVRVKGTKTSIRGENLVLVDANMNHLSEQWFNTDFIPGPIHISQRNDDSRNKEFTACVAGNTCMEDDFLTWRKICFSTKPQIDDLLVYVNTAGYLMDSNESEFHQIPLPPKIVLYRSTGGSIKWKPDSEFSQLDII